jgi:DNA polymerase-1
MQTVAATGRLSSNNPNLQNIPIRTERGRQIRKAFVARDEKLHFGFCGLFSNRIAIAALSGEENMIKAFQNQEDIHKSTASKVFNVPGRTREQRSHAKTVNLESYTVFLLLVKQSNQFLKSADLIEAYYQTYPRLKSYIQDK